MCEYAACLQRKQSESIGCNRRSEERAESESREGEGEGMGRMDVSERVIG